MRFTNTIRSTARYCYSKQHYRQSIAPSLRQNTIVKTWSGWKYSHYCVSCDPLYLLRQLNHDKPITIISGGSTVSMYAYNASDE